MRSLIILLLATTLLANVVPATAQPDTQSLLWRISGNGMSRPSYLFGTLHLKARKLFNFPDSLYTALDNTDVFALEVNPDSMNSMVTDYVAKVLNKNEKEGKGKKEKKLREILTPAELKLLRENLPPGSDIDPDELTVKQVYLMKDRLTAHRARKDDLPTFMDAYLYTIAKDKDKIVAGVEHAEDQVNLLENVDLSAVDPKKMISYFANGASVQDRMIELYINKDLDELQKIADILPEKQAEMLLTVRNRNMLRSMDSIMHKYALFCAVGALHLPGRYGLIALLREKGYTVEPVICKTYTNGATYSFKAKKQQWVEVASEEDGYSIKMPGKPNDVSAGSGTVMMKMYYDLTTSRCYIVNHTSRADNGATPVEELIDAVAKRMMTDAQDVEVKHVTNAGLSGKEYFFTGKSNIHYHLQLLGNATDIFILSAYSQAGEIRHVDSFFNTFRLVPKPASAAKAKTFDDIRLTIAVPANKPTRTVTYSADSTEHQVSYTIVDAATGMYYFVVCNQTGVNSNYNNDTVFLHNIKEKFTDREIAVKVTETRFDNYKSYDIVSEAFKGMRIKTRLIFCGNRVYNLLVQYPDNEQSTAMADAFMQSARIMAVAPAGVHAEVGGNGAFRAFVPAPFVEDTSGASSRSNNAGPVFSVYNSYDDVALLTYQVSAKRLSRYYWAAPDTVMFKTWLNRNIPATDDTVTYSYYTANGMRCAEAIAMKKHADKLHRVKVVADGRTRYTLDCTYPYSFKDNKRIDSFFRFFSVLKKDAEPLQQSPALLLADLHSGDSTRAAEAMNSLAEVLFTTGDAPVLLKDLATAYNTDTAGSDAVILANRFFGILKDFDSVATLGQLEELYRNPVIKAKEQQFQVLDLMGMHADSIAAYKQMKRLLLSLPPTGGGQYMLARTLRQRPAMAKTLYPELLQRCADSNMAYMVNNIACYLIDSGYISKKDIAGQVPTLIKESAELRQHRRANINLLYLLGRVATKEAWQEIAQYQYEHVNYLRYAAAALMIDSSQKTDPTAIDSIAADPYYRLQLYQTVSNKGSISIFPGKYLKQQYFAESYLWTLDEDGEYKNYKAIGDKTVVYKDKRQKFYLYRVEDSDNNSSPHLAIAGPFRTDSKVVSISDDENITGFLADAPDMANLENQLKLYLIKRKISESKQD